MIIGINGFEANIKGRVGVNVYAYELLKQVSKLQDEWKKNYKITVYLQDKPLPDMPRETEFFKYKVIPARRLWTITKLTPELIFGKTKPDIFFTPSHYVPLFSPMPQVCSIMDLGYLKFSGQFKKSDFWQLKLWTAYSVSVSKSIICISNSTKEDIVRHYPFASKKIFVTHLGYNKEKFNTKVSEKDVRRVKERYKIHNDYILFLSTLKPSKNVEGLLEAFSSIQYPVSSIQLVIAGKKGWLYDSIFSHVEDLGLSERVIFTDFVSEEDKPALISGAKCFVLPSFWEGFGLDVLNAMACGVPVIVSKVGSLPEVAGEAGIYIDPYSNESIAFSIKKVLSMSELEYNKLVKMGLAQAAKFSWEKTARETLKILEETYALR